MPRSSHATDHLFGYGHVLFGLYIVPDAMILAPLRHPLIHPYFILPLFHQAHTGLHFLVFTLRHYHNLLLIIISLNPFFPDVSCAHKLWD
ncbi:hypothetical protein F5141DRAFT_609471 [Pisolithus sp. B1]|nr:hypothetical protein F5141DRAFT_609471 [Pisolithus sp. B1]